MLSVDIGVEANPVQFHLLKLVIETWKTPGVIDVLPHSVNSEPVP